MTVRYHDEVTRALFGLADDGGTQPTTEALHGVNYLLSFLPVLIGAHNIQFPRVMIGDFGDGGTVELYYDADNFYLDVHVIDHSTFSVYVRDRTIDTEKFYDEGELNTSQLINLIYDCIKL